MRLFVSTLLLSLISCVGLVRADVTLAPLFSDHAVLQRDKAIPIWGRADVGEKITVTFLDQQVHATVGADGRWLVLLEPLAARTQGTNLIISGHNTVELHDIVVGEVWLCGGSRSVKLAPVSSAHAGETAAVDLPLIRQIRIEQHAVELPTDSARTSGWQVATSFLPEGFTAEGFFFARDLFQKLGVPIGLIDTATKGAPIDSWLSPVAFGNDSAFAAAAERGKQALAARAASEMPMRESFTPTALFNGMINPLLPYAIRGVLWQEEAGGLSDSEDYRSVFPAVIAAWRRHFGQGDFPFYWVQLRGARLREENRRVSLASFRDAQTRALSGSHTGQAITIDLDEETEPAGTTDLQTVGHRLALLAKNRTYGVVVDDAGPTFLSASREGSALRVRLAHATSGLVAHEKPVQSLELAGADKVFRPATAKIERETLLVSSPGVSLPVAVRYAWRNAPEANLYNGAGLPAAPFRSDDW